METQNLQTASAYINNLLLSRGLLRNGKAIEFAKPSKAEEGKTATMARIINLVHDLILKRDVRDTTRTQPLPSSNRFNQIDPSSAKPNTANQSPALSVTCAPAKLARTSTSPASRPRTQS